MPCAITARFDAKIDLVVPNLVAEYELDAKGNAKPASQSRMEIWCTIKEVSAALEVKDAVTETNQTLLQVETPYEASTWDAVKAPGTYAEWEGFRAELFQMVPSPVGRPNTIKFKMRIRAANRL